ncbi:unnamed protein product [Aspergillus oryzae]|uniref:Unnamed protein product n=1 Tax=Aspergillus oryzae var. brunneus TaxID=332754 RepID=A0ABQ6KG59_ASPOZ|nr:unnamed protein product [Aspergillus oryzae]GMF83844.1 unnamed protein product [Aspergillus oryzae]GMG42686.1 unnamed protein product [Aspergillus oryzae var. brunneus]
MGSLCEVFCKSVLTWPRASAPLASPRPLAPFPLFSVKIIDPTGVRFRWQTAAILVKESGDDRDGFIAAYSETQEHHIRRR